MIKHQDFLYIKGSGSKLFPNQFLRCCTFGCKNKPQSMPFYYTEWELVTGASIDPQYCEECVARHLGIPYTPNMEIVAKQVYPFEDMKCQGYRRYGGAFTLGPPQWEPCQEVPEVILTIDGKDMPACKQCWKECIENNMDIQKVVPIT